MGDPLLCRLGFHKWQNYGKEVEVFWQEPTRARESAAVLSAPSEVLNRRFEKRHEAVYEGKQCKRCGVIMMRKFVTNSDGTLSAVGWEEPHAR